MKKKIVSLALVMALVAIVAGGTLAYFTDNDQADNTFELGGVDITLIEKKYENGAWVEIENPDGTATLGQLDPGVVNYCNKQVFTINNEDAAYIRNYVAIESLNETDDVYKIWYQNVNDTDCHETSTGIRHGAVITEEFENVEIDGVLYDIIVFDTIGNVAVGTDESFVTLTTVALDEDVTNEDVEALGDTFEVYTFSEAIQSAGLTHDEAMTALIGEDGGLQAHAVKLIFG